MMTVMCPITVIIISLIPDDDSDGAHLTSSGIEFQTEESKLSPSVALLCAGIVRRGLL